MHIDSSSYNLCTRRKRKVDSCWPTLKKLLITSHPLPDTSFPWGTRPVSVKLLWWRRPWIPTTTIHLSTILWDWKICSTCAWNWLFGTGSPWPAMTSWEGSGWVLALVRSSHSTFTNYLVFYILLSVCLISPPFTVSTSIYMKKLSSFLLINVKTVFLSACYVLDLVKDFTHILLCINMILIARNVSIFQYQRNLQPYLYLYLPISTYIYIFISISHPVIMKGPFNKGQLLL